MRRAYEAMSFLRRRGGAQDLSITRGRTIQDFILRIHGYTIGPFIVN